MFVGRFTFTRAPEFLFNVDFQIRLRNVSDRNSHSAAGLVFKNHFAFS
jgi:hypothetical protein